MSEQEFWQLVNSQETLDEQLDMFLKFVDEASDEETEEAAE
jgi:hypothetical protein